MSVRVCVRVGVGWNHVEALDSLIRKAGWEGRISDSLRASVRVERYQSSKAHLGYNEYMARRNARNGTANGSASNSSTFTTAATTTASPLPSK